MGVTSGAETAYSSRAPEFTPVFSGIHVTQSLVLCFCLQNVVCSFVLLLLVIVLSFLLRFSDSDYPFSIFL
jgi:hypothetical protein